VGVFIGREIASIGAAAMESSFIDFEAVILWLGSFAAEMPFPGEEGAVAADSESLGDGEVLVWKAFGVGCGKDSVVSIPVGSGLGANPVSDAKSSGVFPGHDGGAGGRADLAGRVAIEEAHAFAGDAVNVRRFVVSGTFDREVVDSEVISEDEEDVWWSSECGCG